MLLWILVRPRTLEKDEAVKIMKDRLKELIGMIFWIVMGVLLIFYGFKIYPSARLMYTSNELHLAIWELGFQYGVGATLSIGAGIFILIFSVRKFVKRVVLKVRSKFNRSTPDLE